MNNNSLRGDRTYIEGDDFEFFPPHFYRPFGSKPKPNTAWQMLTPAESHYAWDFMYNTLQFTTCINSCGWPGIVEPISSVTYTLGEIYGGKEHFERINDDIHEKTLRILQQVVEPGEMLYALDWHHLCYLFQPHIPFKPGMFEGEETLWERRTDITGQERYERLIELGYEAQPGEWPIPVWPNGDYHIFLARDYSYGIFGHPWERTMCIFGEPLMTLFEQPENKPLLFKEPIRRNGEWLVDREVYYAERDSQMKRNG